MKFLNKKKLQKLYKFLSLIIKICQFLLAFKQITIIEVRLFFFFFNK